MPSKATNPSLRKSQVSVDGIGRRIEVPDPVRRVVSLVPSLTDLCVELGAGDRLVGISDVCLQPPDSSPDIVRVGGEKRPSLEIIRRLAPDLVLAGKEDNRRQDVDRLRDSGIAVHVSHARTVEEGAELCAELSALLGLANRGRALAAEIRKAKAEGRRLGLGRPVDAVAVIWRDPYMTISGEAYGHDVLACLGGRNLFASSTQRYPKVTLEAIARQAPALILLLDELYTFTAGDKAQVEMAVPGATVIGCPGRPFFWPGPRAREIPHLAEIISKAFKGGAVSPSKAAGSRRGRPRP